MALGHGVKIVTDGLVLALDAANQKGISPLMCEGFNGAPGLLKNLTSSNVSLSAVNGVKLSGDMNFYTAFAIDFPESSFGGDAINRQGITPGFNVRSGTKLYDASRALHLWVWDNDTNSWISSSFFNGLRLSGHSYDSFTGYADWQIEVAKFVTDYNNIKNLFPNATYVIMGSHRDSGHTTDKINILLDCGAPSNVSSLLGGSPEWILVGKPGLGPDNAYGWAYENYSTDPTQVAHLNFGLPIFGNKNNHISFDGTNESVNISETASLNLLSYTYSFWIRRKAGQSSNFLQFLQRSTSDRNPGIWFYFNEINRIHFSIKLSNGTNTSVDPGGFFQNEWHYFTATVDYNGTNTVMRGYTDGELKNTNTLANVSPITGTGGSYVGRQLMDLGNLQIYNRALTPTEVKQNFNALRGRYGI
jgi:hypothetical protein